MYLFGASGHGKVIAEIAEDLGIDIKGFVDANSSITTILNYSVIANSATDLFGEAVISIGSNRIRKQIAIDENHLNFVSLLSPKANISKRTSIGEGTVVMPGAVVNVDVEIGRHCIVNTSSSIDHDCVLADFVHISPNVALAGNVTVGEGTHVGIGAMVIQGVNIGKWCTIGAGSVILKDVPDFAVVVGNPGRIIKFNNP